MSTEHTYTEQTMLDASHRALQRELGAVWNVLHALVHSRRHHAETCCPAIFKRYDELCTLHGETAREGNPGQ